MRNLFRLMKIPSSLKPTGGVLTRSRVSAARHLPGAKSLGKAAVIQICLDPGCCYVKHFFHSGLRELLENSAFTKVRVSIRNDACKVLKDHDVKVHDLMDLSSLANLKFGGKAISWGLRSLTEKLFSIQLKKCNLVQLGNWEAIELSRSRLEYAAANAVASWRIYQKQILKTVTTKGDELKKKIFKMPLVACKSWMALISDPFFINSHKIKNQIVISTETPEIITLKVVENINSGVVVYLMDGIKGRHMSCFRLFWTTVDCNLNLTFGNDTIIAHCNGLFLIGRTAQRLLVCNPATREVVALPPTTYFPDAVHELSGIGIGLDHSTNKYKVVRIFLRKEGIGGVEVITVDGGNYNSWRRLETYPPYMMTFNLTVVTIQGASYWIIDSIKIDDEVDDNDPTIYLVILRFDLSSEEFTVIDSPGPDHVINLAELEGRLCCYAEAQHENSVVRTIFVWLYNESDNIATDRWRLRYTIHHLFTPTLGHHASFKPIAIDQEGCLLFECDQLMHRYDPRTNKFYRTLTDDRNASPEIKTWYCHTTSYVETLVPLSTTTTCD